MSTPATAMAVGDDDVSVYCTTRLFTSTLTLILTHLTHCSKTDESAMRRRGSAALRLHSRHNIILTPHPGNSHIIIQVSGFARTARTVSSGDEDARTPNAWRQDKRSSRRIDVPRAGCGCVGRGVQVREAGMWVCGMWDVHERIRVSSWCP